MSQEFRLYVLPISGGGFPVQLALLSRIFDAYKINKTNFSGGQDYTPNLVLGASGGNIAAYIAMAGDWKYEGICRISENINNNMFIKSWWPDDLDFIPTWVLTIFTGTIYRSGYGPGNLLRAAFNKNRIMETEILTLAFNSTKYVPQLFSNQNQETSLINSISEMDKTLFNLEDIQYMDGDIEKISEACMASAAIPVVTQPQYIGDSKYDDGGLSSASPLSILPEELYQLILKNNQYLHLTYFASYNMDVEDKTEFLNFGGARLAIGCMLHSKVLQDRANAIILLERIKGSSVIKEDYKYVSVEFLAEKMLSLKESHYVLYLYPDNFQEINITNFTNLDIINLIDKVRNHFNFSIWY